MSSITINSNIASLNAQRRLGQSTNSLRDSFTRLSSGLRINKASDDAAGLAIAESLKTDQRVLNQGVRNLNDGVSLLSIADGALNELSSITIRLTELAEQAANGALSSTQRGALDEEAQALKDEFFRISKTTEFNGVKLFDGNFGDLRLQAGFGANGGINSSLGGAIGTGTFNSAETFNPGDNPSELLTADFNGDGLLDIATANVGGGGSVGIALGNGDGSFRGPISFVVDGSAASITTGDFDGDGVLDIATGNSNNTTSVLFGDGKGSFSASVSISHGTGSHVVTAGDFNGDGIDDLATAAYFTGGIAIALGASNRDVSIDNSLNIPISSTRTIVSGDFNDDGMSDLAFGNTFATGFRTAVSSESGSLSTVTVNSAGSLSMSALAVGDIDGDGVDDIVSAGEYGGFLYGFQVFKGASDGTFSYKPDSGVLTLQTAYSAELGDLNGDGVLDLVVSELFGTQVYLGNQDSSFNAGVALTGTSLQKGLDLGDLDQDGAIDIVTSFAASDTINVHTGLTTSGVAPLLDFSLRTQVDARQALPQFQQKLDQLASQRGQIGAFEARVTTAVATNRVASENFAAAKSQISDTEVAVEAARLIQNQILQQAGAAILAQANQGPSLALALLG